jgi:putative peptidoglycan lipid II flippase
VSDAHPEGGGSSLLSSSAVMAAGTLLSRLTGFVRAAMIAAALGIGVHAEQFNIANTVPNMLYILLAGGVFNTVLVPQLVRSMRNDDDGGDAYANRVLTLSMIGLAVVTAAVVALAPWLMRIFLSPRWRTPPLHDQLGSLIDLSRYCLAQIFFYGMFVLLGQVLNARGRFGPMMWAPIANNVVSVAVLGAYLGLFGVQNGTGAYTSHQEFVLGFGATLGIVVQTLLLLPFLKAAGFRFRPRFDFLHTGLSHTLRLGMWTVMFVIVNQIAYTVVVRLASAGSARAVTGGPADSPGYTVYSNAFLLMMVPHAIITVSLATATLPAVSRLAADARFDRVRSELAGTMRLALSLIVPIAAGLVALGPVIATFIFGWGAAAGDTAPLGYTVMAFAPGLVFFTSHYLVLRGFYALEDTSTPFVVQCAIAATNIALALLLTRFGPDVAYTAMLALAYAGSYLVGSLLSMQLLARRLGGFERARLAVFLGRTLVAALPAAGAAWLVQAGLSALGLHNQNPGQAIMSLALSASVALPVFVGCARALKISEVSDITSTLTRRLRPSR